MSYVQFYFLSSCNNRQPSITYWLAEDQPSLLPARHGTCCFASITNYAPYLIFIIIVVLYGNANASTNERRVSALFGAKYVTRVNSDLPLWERSNQGNHMHRSNQPTHLFGRVSIILAISRQNPFVFRFKSCPLGISLKFNGWISRYYRYGEPIYVDRILRTGICGCGLGTIQSCRCSKAVVGVFKLCYG